MEQQTGDTAVWFVWVGQGETPASAWQRYIARPNINPDGAIRARHGDRVTFVSWTPNGMKVEARLPRLEKQAFVGEREQISVLHLIIDPDPAIGVVGVAGLGFSRPVLG